MSTAEDSFLRQEERGLIVQVLVCPRGSRERIEGIQDGRLKVRLTAPPVEGAANVALCAFLAKTLGLPKRAVTLLAGQSGRRKTLLLSEISLAAAREKLSPADSA